MSAIIAHIDLLSRFHHALETESKSKIGSCRAIYSIDVSPATCPIRASRNQAMEASHSRKADFSRKRVSKMSLPPLSLRLDHCEASVQSPFQHIEVSRRGLVQNDHS